MPATWLSESIKYLNFIRNKRNHVIIYISKGIRYTNEGSF